MVYDTFELVDTCTAVKQLLGRWNKMIGLLDIDKDSFEPIVLLGQNMVWH